MPRSASYFQKPAVALRHHAGHALTTAYYPATDSTALVCEDCEVELTMYDACGREVDCNAFDA